jgi:hypothetical protein
MAPYRSSVLHGCLHYCMWYLLYVMGKNCLLLTYLLSYFVLLEKLTGSQLVKKFPTCNKTWRFITAFTSAHHLSLSWASLIQSTSPLTTSWRSMLILPYHLCVGLPSGLFLSGFPAKTLYTPLLSPICEHALPLHSYRFNHSNMMP